MDYVVLRSSHPTWLTLQLPADAVDLLKFRPPSARTASDGTGSITFLSRGPGIARVLATHLAREAIAVESVRDRLIASARPGARHLFSLPTALLSHLGLQVTVRGPREGKGTDDQILWFLPAAEYYGYRQAEADRSAWRGPSVGGSAHLYVARSILPPPRGVSQLAAMDDQIERVEWAAATQAFTALSRGHRAVDAR